MTEIIIAILAELLSVLALATKQIKQGRFSKYADTYTLSVAQPTFREVRKEVTGRERDRGCAGSAVSIYAGRGSDDCRRR